VDWAFKADGLFAIIWIMLATIALSTILERSRFQRYIPGPILVLIIPCTLANIGFLPSQSPIYNSISDIAIPFGVTLLLLRANIGEILRSSGKMLPLFLSSAVGVIIAILLVGQIMHFEDDAGLWALSTALFVGSVLNVVAAAGAIQSDQTLIAGIIAANALVAPAYLAVLMIMMQSKAVGRLIGVPPGASLGSFTVKEAPREGEKLPVSAPAAPLGQLYAILYALGVFLVVDYFSRLAGIENYAILVVTAVAVAVPNLFPRIRNYMSNAREIGMIAMFLFIGAISAQIDLGALGFFSLRVMLFMTVVLALNLVFLIAIGRLFKADPQVLFLASLAGVGGPTSTAAVAAAHGREDLVTPGILCALSGVVISTFIAVFGYQLLIS
jgi:Predicted integral membrane protein